MVTRDNAATLANKLIAAREMARSTFTMLDEVLTLMEANGVCRHVPADRENLSPFGANEHWVCKCGYRYPEDAANGASHGQ